MLVDRSFRVLLNLHAGGKTRVEKIRIEMRTEGEKMVQCGVFKLACVGDSVRLFAASEHHDVVSRVRTHICGLLDELNEVVEDHHDACIQLLSMLNK
jgi:hypothetical protein